MKKKLLSVMFALCLACGTAASPYSAGTTYAATNIEINADNFPDYYFRDAVRAYDTNSNNVLEDKEIKRVVQIDVPSRNVESLEGIEYFTELESLRCSNSKLEKLDLSKNTALIKLDCRDNQLLSLDLSKNAALVELYCHDNELAELKLNSKTYDKLQLSLNNLPGAYRPLSDFQNITLIGDTFKVNDITQPATYRVDGKVFTIMYVDAKADPTAPSGMYLFTDYDYNNPVTDCPVIYGNGIAKTINGKKVNNKALTVYTDILASYKYTLNGDKVKPSIGKVVAVVTKSDEKPVVDSRNRVTDKSASQIAKAKIKNGQVTVTAVGKEGGLVYLWVIDTGSKGVSACCPINVRVAPKRLEVQDASGNRLRNANLGNGGTLEVYVAGIVSGSAKTYACTYTATVDSKYQNYISVTPVDESENKFAIKATGLKNGKKTKVTVTFKCDQNGKKVKFPFTITP